MTPTTCLPQSRERARSKPRTHTEEKMSSPKKAEKEESKVNVLELLEDDDEFEVILLSFDRFLTSRNRSLSFQYTS